MSGEAGSRAYLDLPGNQQQLLEAVVAAGKPVVLLVFSGRPLVLDWAANMFPPSWRSGSPEPRPATPSPTFSTEMSRPAASCP